MSDDDAARRVAENVARVRERIARSAERSGRAPEQVRLIAVTKYVGPELLPALLAAGCLDFGESRPQELWKKAAALAADPPATPPRWHLIGHLQRNKLDRTLPLVTLVHSGDSERLLDAMNAWAERAGRRLPVLLEVKLSGEANKGGFAPEALPALGQRLPELANLDVRGLMAMASLASAEVEGDVARLEFARLRALRDAAERDWAGAGRLPELSMGMSGDYELAIEEGATMVRVGSALFEGLR